MISSQFAVDVQLRRDIVPGFDDYPFSLPAVRLLDRLTFHPAVTFLVGENGSGKSTLLEAIAINCGFNAEGGSKNFNFGTRESHSSLHQFLRIAKGFRRPKMGSSCGLRASTTSQAKLTALAHWFLWR
jgi:predicted ATPase